MLLILDDSLRDALLLSNAHHPGAIFLYLHLLWNDAGDLGALCFAEGQPW